MDGRKTMTKQSRYMTQHKGKNDDKIVQRKLEYTKKLPMPCLEKDSRFLFL